MGISHQRNFNPRSLAGATHIPYSASAALYISIHAPLRERLDAGADAARFGMISIHAPLRERHIWQIGEKIDCGFQSTLPCGSDRNTLYVEYYVEISIHAPLRERHAYNAQPIAGNAFQSTLPCGSDGLLLAFLRSLRNFNPRSLAGATRYDCALLLAS